jgi:hypothetical protein
MSAPAKAIPLYSVYKHELPASKDLGFAIVRFPPVISAVDPEWKGRLFVGQTVESLYIPGEPLMNLQAGGFTAANVKIKLASTVHMKGRILSVRDGHKVETETGSNAPFDPKDCIIL